LESHGLHIYVDQLAVRRVAEVKAVDVVVS